MDLNIPTVEAGHTGSLVMIEGPAGCPIFLEARNLLLGGRHERYRTECGFPITAKYEKMIGQGIWGPCNPGAQRKGPRASGKSVQG